MNQIDCHFYDCKMGYEHFLLDGDGDTIISYLGQAKEYGKAELEAMAKEFNVRLDPSNPQAT